ncbi:uncharacterized protein STEHIDRAFT_65660 [Stereum hirsutum FP-91666 SS1]|uniref:uncharacterized protein n=1 Tax=Stereum hirsutum (strain FP-91666) TaxID=721885 RepID=UPI000444A424|nr:uncharacterized protein STEHIDRAFT_65660 [Stereum hirsutum FP-91666 SS1]EIM82184.1 hypothetical protein STEHIDRAFT_65660 [Stereum hirsutum FP-91666 SS1]
MPRATSDDLHACILHWRLHKGHSLEECAERAGVIVRTIQNILATKRNHNSLRNPCCLPPGRRRLLEHDDNTYISSILAAQPTLFIDKIHDCLEAARGKLVSLSTLSHTITRVGLSHKKVSQEALECNDLLRASWQVKMANYTPDQLLFIDESGGRPYHPTCLRLLSAWLCMCSTCHLPAWTEVFCFACSRCQWDCHDGSF